MVDPSLIEEGAIITLRARVFSYNHAILLDNENKDALLGALGELVVLRFTDKSVLYVEARPLRAGDKVTHLAYDEDEVGEVVFVRGLYAWVDWPEHEGRAPRQTIHIIDALRRVTPPAASPAEPPAAYSDAAAMEGHTFATSGPWAQRETPPDHALSRTL